MENHGLIKRIDFDGRRMSNDRREEFVNRQSSIINRPFLLSPIPHPRSPNTGFTLIEIVLALGIFSIGILGVLALFPVGIDAHKRALDYSNAMNLAEWKMADISIYSIANYTCATTIKNSLTCASSYPMSGPNPQPFTENVNNTIKNTKYAWHYDVTTTTGTPHDPNLNGLSNIYRVDLKIYSVDNTTTAIDTVVTYVEQP